MKAGFYSTKVAKKIKDQRLKIKEGSGVTWWFVPLFKKMKKLRKLRNEEA